MRPGTFEHCVRDVPNLQHINPHACRRVGDEVLQALSVGYLNLQHINPQGFGRVGGESLQALSVGYLNLQHINPQRVLETPWDLPGFPGALWGSWVPCGLLDLLGFPGAF